MLVLPSFNLFIIPVLHVFYHHSKMVGFLCIIKHVPFLTAILYFGSFFFGFFYNLVVD